MSFPELVSIALQQHYDNLKALAKKCGISLNHYLTETGLKHHPRERLTKEEVDTLNSLVYARTDLIKITSVLSKKTDEEKLKLFKSEKFMTWWMKSVAELIQHWYSIEENISSPVLTKERSAI